MEKDTKADNELWIDFLYFAYKKAKHFVTKETSFVDNIEIIKFEEKLDENIEKLADLLNDEDKLEKTVKEMQGNLYFIPKSFGPNKESRIRPKVAFPFKYQIMWAAVILRIGEWFDTNKQLKNIYSMRDEKLRNELDWMVSWSFNGRIKRLTSKVNEGQLESSYIQYNDSRLYESHQLSLRKFHTYESKVTKDLFERSSKVYKAELDIREFFPTLRKDKIKDMFRHRFASLTRIKCFKKDHFDPFQMEIIINILLDLQIVYPDSIENDNQIYEVLESYYKKSVVTKNKENKIVSSTGDTDSNENIIPKLVDALNKTLPLDLIASNFISNCTLNHYVDTKINVKQDFPNVYILRYTDDYLVIANNRETVKKVIDQIKDRLEDTGLSYSYEKTLPTKINDIVEKLDIINKNNNWNEEYYPKIKKWFEFHQYLELNQSLSEIFTNPLYDLQAKTLMVGIKIEPEEILRDDVDKELTISELSSTSDIKLQSLSDEELNIHMRELMVYMQAKGDIGELKEETAKTFAAWRLNASHQEQTYRKPYDIEDIKVFLSTLEEAIIKHPYKLGFFDIYILLLLKVIEHSGTGYKELEDFLMKIMDILKASSETDSSKPSEGKFDNSEQFLGSCFPAIRIRILNLVSNNWNHFEEKKRKKLRTILDRTFIKWYANPKVNWEELYVMYSSFFVLRIRLPLDICKVEEKHPKFLAEIAMAYNNYFFITKKSNHAGIVEDNTKIKSIAIAIDLLKRGLYWDRFTKEFEFNEMDQLIYKKIKMEIKQGNSDIYNRLAFARIAPQKLEIEDWNSLIDFKISENEEFTFEVFDFLQLNIQLYFENPKKHSNILEWSEKANVEDTQSEFIIYVGDRFLSYRKIRSYFSLTDERFPPLLKEKEKNSEYIPIADWIFYCQTLPYHLETSPKKQRVLHPLTEYEFVNILVKINKNEENPENSGYVTGENFVEKNSLLFRFKMNFIEWSNFRLGKKVEDFKKNKEDSEIDEDVSKMDKEDPKTDKKYARILFSMLTNRPWHIHVNKKFSMFKWNDLQSYFEMTYYPSTPVATLFVNHLNIHQDFYSKIYNMPLEELPYREIYTSERTGNIKLWMENYIEKQKNNQVYKNDNRKLELLEIDIDQLRS